MSAAALAGTPPLDAFTYVDTAINGAWNRNRVMALADFHPPPDARDVFATYCRFTPELADYAATNPLVAPHKRPSVNGYRGQAFAAFLPVDCDDAADPDRARADAIRIVRTLEARPRRAASGGPCLLLRLQGVLAGDSRRLFGGFAPAADLPARFKRLVLDLFRDCSTLDPSIYETVRLWRWPNSRHGKSGLFKVRLSLGELERLSIDAIRALAASPRLFPDDPPDDDWFPRAGLVDAWTATAMPQNDQTSDAANCGVAEGSRPLTPERQRAVVALMARHWHAGQKHTVALGLAGWLALAGVPSSRAWRCFRR